MASAAARASAPVPRRTTGCARRRVSEAPPPPPAPGSPRPARSRKRDGARQRLLARLEAAQDVLGQPRSGKCDALARPRQRLPTRRPETRVVRERLARRAPARRRVLLFRRCRGSGRRLAAALLFSPAFARRPFDPCSCHRPARADGSASGRARIATARDDRRVHLRAPRAMPSSRACVASWFSTRGMPAGGSCRRSIAPALKSARVAPATCSRCAQVGARVLAAEAAPGRMPRRCAASSAR